MRRIVATGITAAVVILAIASPILFAIHQARKTGLETEANRALAYARDIQRRTDTASDQIFAGIETLLKLDVGQPCSDAGIAAMRKIDLESSYIQTVIYISRNHVVCSSLETQGVKWDLGPVDYVTPRGYAVRYNVALPFAKETHFIVVDRFGFGAIVHKDLLIDVTTDEQDVSLASLALINGNAFASRGIVKPQWLARLPDTQNETTFVDDGYVVAVARSTRYFIVGIAAVPIAYVEQRVHDLAIYMLPIGAAAGLILAVAVFYLARVQRAMPTVIKSALRRNEFIVMYQPIVELRTDRWVGAEALVRWVRTNGEVVRPDLFIPIAEETGLIQRITERVVEIITRDVGDLFKRHSDFHIAINLSSADLKSMRTIELLRRLREDLNASPQNIIVEATERGFLHADKARDVIRQIRANGIRVAVDDFGTGYSSLSYLETFELDFLKIDKSFVDTLGTGAATSHVAMHIIQMAKDLRLDMVAEGVETEAQAQFLRGHGVRYAQGYLFGKPMTMKDLLNNLSGRTDSPNDSDDV